MIYLKFPHLDLLWTHMAELVECFNRHCFTIMFVNTLIYDLVIFNLLLHKIGTRNAQRDNNFNSI